MSSESLPPIRRSVTVSWDQETAFKRFTDDFASWWPKRTHSIGGEFLERIVFEEREGGRIYEEHRDGRRFQWGEVTFWDPPKRVKFLWHPSRDPSTAQEVDIEFVKEASGTTLQLVSSGWERWGKGASRARRGYDVGWGYVLNVWAGQRTFKMALLDGVAALMMLGMKLRGGRQAEIARAGGEMKSASQES